MTHILKGRLKVTMEEADKEKALKQVTESTLNEKGPWAGHHGAKGGFC